MRLLSVLNKLALGELSQTGLNKSEGVGIDPVNYPMLINHINLGLLDLHTKFDIKRSTVVIQQFDHIQTYKLDAIYAESNTTSTQPYKYIMDSVYEPYLDDAICIERVFSEIGVELPLNDDMDELSLHTPSQLSIQVPLPEAENSIMVEYRASHHEIPDTLDESEMAMYTIDLPIAYLKPLMAYVASRVLTPLADSQSPTNEGKDYEIRYEIACQKLTELAIPNVANNTNINVRRNGWV